MENVDGALNKATGANNLRGWSALKSKKKRSEKLSVTTRLGSSCVCKKEGQYLLKNKPNTHLSSCSPFHIQNTKKNTGIFDKNNPPKKTEMEAPRHYKGTPHCLNFPELSIKDN